MIRHYEKIGLVPPASRRDSGYRAYSPTEIERFRFIANARDLGFPIEEIAKMLVLWSDRNRASAEVKKLALMHEEELDRKARTLEAMRRSLHDIAERCHGGERTECPIREGLGGLGIEEGK